MDNKRTTVVLTIALVFICAVSVTASFYLSHIEADSNVSAIFGGMYIPDASDRTIADVVVIGDTPYIPVTSVSDLLGLDVRYDSRKKVVHIQGEIIYNGESVERLPPPMIAPPEELPPPIHQPPEEVPEIVYPPDYEGETQYPERFAPPEADTVLTYEDTFINDEMEITFHDANGSINYATARHLYKTIAAAYAPDYNESAFCVPVTIKNISDYPASLNPYSFEAYSPAGLQLSKVHSYFPDDYTRYGTMEPGEEIESYMYLPHDGDGGYKLVFKTYSPATTVRKTIEVNLPIAMSQ